ncbi:sensor histidine kinase [Bdellovibrio sp. HCB290]|uniref:sensor histidine kinase n=1 Tax=Bdellovibrio sp. HCB290 TaxID=3394356 RepID=UPI0039B412B8
MSFSKYLPKFHNFLSLIVLIVAVVVMVGWILKIPIAFRFFPNSSAMVFNTAFLFAFISLGVLFSDRDHFKVGRACAIVVMLMSAAMFIQYPLNLNFGIDEFFVKYFEPSKNTFPGRSAASTCLAAFLLGLGVFFNKTTLLCRFVRLTVSATVCGIGFIGIVGNAFTINSQFGWGSFAKMAPHTAACFIILSVALVLQLRGRLIRIGLGRRHFRPYYVLITGVFLTIGFQQLLVIKDYQKNRSITEIRLNAMLENFDSTFRSLSQSLGRMAEHFVAQDYRNSEAWQLDAKLYTQEIKGIRRVLWSEADMKVKWYYPMTGEIERLRGMKISQQRGTMGILDSAIQSRKPVVSDAVQLLTGGEGLLLYYPVFKGDKLIGVLSVALEVDTFFQNAAKAPEYFVQITDDDGHEFLNTGGAGQFYMQDWSETAKYKALNTNWTFRLTPMPALVRENSSSLPALLMFFGLSVSILLSVNLVFYARSRDSERKMRELNDWHKAGRDSISLLLLQLDQFGNISNINKAAVDLLGYTEEELLGKKVFVLADHHDTMMYRGRMEELVQRRLVMGADYLEAIFESGEAKGYERVFVTKDGKRLNMALSLHRVNGEQNEISGYLVVGEDVTQKKERERLLKEREEKVIVSSRLASLGEMAAGIAHEINNPLAVMGGYISVIRKSLSNKGLGEDIELNRRMDSVESMVGRIAKIVKGLRSYAHESALDELQSVEVAEIIDDTLAFCHEKFKVAGIQLSASVEPGLIVHCRPYQISQVLLNMLNNAFDAVEHAALRKVRITANYRDNGVDISVTDSGPGVPLEVRDRIMQPFFTTKEVGKGVGLGLSISAGIIEAHNGKFYLDADSKETKFTIWLPN